MPRIATTPLITGAAMVLAVLLAPSVAAQQSGDDDLVMRYRDRADLLIRSATRDSAAYNRIAILVDAFGHRLSGSASLERAIDWILEQMKKDGLQNVRGEPVMVPRWERGEESLELVAPRAARLPMLGLGGSIGTPAEGITAELLVVSSFDELAARAAEASGKIVLFDAPFTNYGQTVQYRTNGAIAAARAGAVASLIRSVTPVSMRSPHTGSMLYEEGVPRIPHAAISTEDASLLHRMQQRGEKPVVRLRMGARTLPDAPSRNIVAELVGSELPDEFVVVGGHIDSWDVGQGAMDDAGGSVAAWEAVRLIQRLGLRPRRTIRVVLWTNEENGLRGAEAYRKLHAPELPKHVLAIETDGGVFRPTGFGFTGSDAALETLQRVGRLLEGVGAGLIEHGGGGADIGPLMATGVPGMGLLVDSRRYFWYHHSEADTLDKLNANEVAQCVAALAVMAFVVADLPEPLPRATSN